MTWRQQARRTTPKTSKSNPTCRYKPSGAKSEEGERATHLEPWLYVKKNKHQKHQMHEKPIKAQLMFQASPELSHRCAHSTTGVMPFYRFAFAKGKRLVVSCQSAGNQPKQVQHINNVWGKREPCVPASFPRSHQPLSPLDGPSKPCIAGNRIPNVQFPIQCATGSGNSWYGPRRSRGRSGPQQNPRF